MTSSAGAYIPRHQRESDRLERVEDQSESFSKTYGLFEASVSHALSREIRVKYFRARS